MEIWLTRYATGFSSGVGLDKEEDKPRSQLVYWRISKIHLWIYRFDASLNHLRSFTFLLVPSQLDILNDFDYPSFVVFGRSLSSPPPKLAIIFSPLSGIFVP